MTDVVKRSHLDDLPEEHPHDKRMRLAVESLSAEIRSLLKNTDLSRIEQIELVSTVCHDVVKSIARSATLIERRGSRADVG